MNNETGNERAETMGTDWMDATIDRIEEFGEQHGWSVRLDSKAETGSCYWELFRPASAADDTPESIEDYGMTGGETVSLRISDHGDCYCRSDYSLAENPGGDDTTIETVLRRLALPPKDDGE